MDKFDNESILYELLEYLVKKQDPELIKCKNDSAILSTTGTIKNALRYLNNRYSLPESISQQISLTLPWKFTIGDNGRILAILQENIIDIRRSKDEFSSTIGKGSVPKDAFPQWRKISWSPDGTILVLASSNGYLSFYNSLGNNIFNISPKTISQNPDILEAGDAISSLMFNEPKIDKDKWNYEIKLVTYSGLLKSYNISLTNGYKKNYEFSFGNYYRQGVNAFAYDKKHNLYFVAGNSIIKNISSPSGNTGLTSWRPLNDEPYYKLSFTFNEITPGKSTLSLWNLIPKFYTPPEPVIFRISISPSCDNLICLHTDGTISLWNLPNLVLNKKWKLNEQPDYNIKNPLVNGKIKKFPAGLSEFHPVDIGWWSNHAIIVTRYSGAVSVCSMNNLNNLLGKCPEFLYGQPQISKFYIDKGFLCLDCDTIVTSKKRNIESSHDDNNFYNTSDSSDENVDELEPITIINYATNIIHSALYSMTDIEKFQPKRRKSKILQRTYRILGLKSTTPEELYLRKIDIEDYDEALKLANSYNLDKDLVYQTQWRKSDFSVKAIDNHLSKVTKRSWVLSECIMRVPETFDAARQLLNFGLKGANFETFMEIAETDDEKIFIDTNNDDNDDENLDEISLNLRNMQKINEILRTIDSSKLSQSQKCLLNYRKKLLNHMDKLKTYEIIMKEMKNYKKEFYQEFRSLSIVENAIKFSKNCNYQAVEIMFTYHGTALMPHWLGIINCFPETLCPKEYRKLLPECDEEGQLFLLHQRELRPMDWAENCKFKNIIENDTNNDANLIYEAEPFLSSYRNTELTMDLLKKWYKSRAYQIERDSSVVENALELLKIGKSNKIKGLEDLLMELETLDDLVYKLYLDNMSLLQLEKLSDLEKVKLLMSTSQDKKTFVLGIKNYVIPFLKRKDKYLDEKLDKKLLPSYLVMLSEDDLSLCAEFFHQLVQDTELLDIIDDIMTVGLNCIYSCTNSQCLDQVREIFEAIPKPLGSREGTLSSMEELEKEIDCLHILNKYNVKTTIKFINENKSEPDDVKLILTNMADCLKEQLPPPNQYAWTELLNDMLDIQSLIFSCIDIDVCFEICLWTKLTSGINVNIQNCKSLIETKKTEKSLLKVSYNKAIELILEASKEYFDTCKNFNDTNIELAKACLHLIEDDNPDIRREYDLINSLKILEEFNVKILPLHVRLCPDRLKLIENCLNNSETGYKRKDRLLTLAAYLQIEKNNKRLREGKVLELIASKSFEYNDFTLCSDICKIIINNNHHLAWKIIKQLGYSDSYTDLTFRQKCLWFTMTYGPSEILEDSLRKMHLIEIQILNNNLENYMKIHDTNESTDKNNSDDDDDDFTDAITKPQIEIKEFVPNIIEASTGIVKNSAKIFTQSTLGILKNVGNQNFWKKTLNINSTNIWENLYDIDDNIRHEKSRDDVQSFPYFYQSLYDNYLISRIDTKYTKYTVPDIDNTKLKICQTLLRLSTLGETACYGVKVSDIDHLFVQLSGHIVSDDWLLGLAYLLSIKNNKIIHVNEVFKNLPSTDLYLQTAIYYYSLELFIKLNPGSIRKALAYHPGYLIEIMREKIKENESEEIEKALSYWHKRLVDKNSPPVVEENEGWDDEIKFQNDELHKKSEEIEFKNEFINRENEFGESKEEELDNEVKEEGWADQELDIDDEDEPEVEEIKESKINTVNEEAEGWDVENDLIGVENVVEEGQHDKILVDELEQVEEGWDHEFELEDDFIDNENEFKVEEIEENKRADVTDRFKLEEKDSGVKTQNLYDNEAFKMNMTDDAVKGSGWDENWEDFSDEDDVQTSPGHSGTQKDATRISF